jgi:4-amino-4-deoxy-L-arabinose transferase-like glycosyltransferase
LVVLHKALQQLSADKALIGVYLVVFVFGSPLLFRASQVAMSDVFGMFCIVCVCYLLLAHTRSAAWWQVPVVGMCFSVGFFTRYVGVLYCIPFLLYWLSKQTGIKTVCILVLVVVVASIPQMVLKQGQETVFSIARVLAIMECTQLLSD